MVHPIVEGAENFSYQIWPVDETCTWDAKFGMLAQRKQCWRVIKMIPEKVGIGEVIDSTLKRGVEEGAVPFKQERGFRENVATTRKKAKLTKDKKVRDVMMITRTKSITNSRKQSESNEALKTQKASSETREARRLKEEALKEKKALKEEALKEKNALKKKALKEKEALKEKNVLKKNNVLKKEKMLKAKRS
jgi:hypothetical protein